MKNFILAIFGFISIAIGAYFCYKLIIYLITYLQSLSPNPNIIVAIIAGIVTMSGYVVARYFERKKIIEQQIREQKLPVYEEFISFIFHVIKNVKEGKETDQAEMTEFMMNFNKKSIVWLSDSSLKAYTKWRKSSSDFADGSDKSTEATMRQMLVLEELFLEFRKDIGHSNKNLKPGDLLSLFVNDVDQYL